MAVSICFRCHRFYHPSLKFIHPKLISRTNIRHGSINLFYKPSILSYINHSSRTNQFLREFHHKHKGQSTKPVSVKKHHHFFHWVPITVGIGIGLAFIIQFRRLQKQKEYPPEGIVKEFEIAVYLTMPLRLWSRFWGFLCSIYIPTPLRSIVYGAYSSLYGCNLDEMSGKLTDFPNLGKFFIRKLKKGARPIDPDDPIVSPADGRVLNAGNIHHCHVEQVKGVKYNLQTFLGKPTWKNPQSQSDGGSGDGVKLVANVAETGQTDFDCIGETWEEFKAKLIMNPQNRLYQAVIYLAPGDYHRFHSPVSWNVVFRRHFQGELLSVNPLIAGWLPGLYSLNERVVYVGKWKYGFFSMTAVGATSVGSVQIYADKDLTTNTPKWRDGTTHKDKVMSHSWAKGENIGNFNMGSTLVLVFEAPKDYKFNLFPQKKVKVGESISAVKI